MIRLLNSLIDSFLKRCVLLLALLYKNIHQTPNFIFHQISLSDGFSSIIKFYWFIFVPPRLLEFEESWFHMLQIWLSMWLSPIWRVKWLWKISDLSIHLIDIRTKSLLLHLYFFIWPRLKDTLEEQGRKRTIFWSFWVSTYTHTT